MAAARSISLLRPTLAARIKSAGEQLTGQAFWQGFSSQNSHFVISAFSWASLKKENKFTGMASSLNG
jgi:hypothetical protein